MGRKAKSKIPQSARAAMKSEIRTLKSEGLQGVGEGTRQVTDWAAVREARQAAGVTNQRKWSYQPSDLVTIKTPTGQITGTIITVQGRHATVLSERGLETVDFRYIRIIERFEDPCDP